MRLQIFLTVLIVTLVWAGSASAQTAETGKVDTLSHKGQVGVSLQLGTGYRVLFPYNEEYCGQANKSVCTARSPFYVDAGLSYAVTPGVELLVEGRFGLENDFANPAGVAGSKPLALSAGARIYLEAEGTVKFFSTIQAVAELTDYSNVLGDKSADFGLRNTNGVLFDLHRTFGVYVHFGETATFVSWMRFELHAGIGLQARFP